MIISRTGVSLFVDNYFNVFDDVYKATSALHSGTLNGPKALLLWRTKMSFLPSYIYKLRHTLRKVKNKYFQSQTKTHKASFQQMNHSGDIISGPIRTDLTNNWNPGPAILSLSQKSRLFLTEADFVIVSGNGLWHHQKNLRTLPSRRLLHVGVRFLFLPQMWLKSAEVNVGFLFLYKSRTLRASFKTLMKCRYLFSGRPSASRLFTSFNFNKFLKFNTVFE